MSINELIQRFPKRLPQNDKDWAFFLQQVIGVLTQYQTKEGALTDAMPIDSRGETLANIVQNIDGDGNATDDLQIASRGETFKDILQRLNGSGHALDDFEIASRGDALLNVVQRLNSSGDALDGFKIASRDDALLGIVSKLTDSGQILDMTAFRQRQLLGVFVGGNPITATDAGSDATINIASFAWRVAGKADANYNSGSITGLAYSTTYYIVGSGDPNHTGATLTYTAETTFEATQTNQDTIYLGFITTPAALGGNTGGSGGYEP